MSIFPIKSYTTEVERSASLEMAVLSLLCEAALRARHRVEDITGGQAAQAPAPTPAPTPAPAPAPAPLSVPGLAPKDPKPKPNDLKPNSSPNQKRGRQHAPGGPSDDEKFSDKPRSSQSRKSQAPSSSSSSSSSSGSAVWSPANQPVTAQYRYDQPRTRSTSHSSISSVSSLESHFTHLSTAPLSNTVSPLISLSRAESPGPSVVSEPSQPGHELGGDRYPEDDQDYTDRQDDQEV